VGGMTGLRTVLARGGLMPIAASWCTCLLARTVLVRISIVATASHCTGAVCSGLWGIRHPPHLQTTTRRRQSCTRQYPTSIALFLACGSFQYNVIGEKTRKRDPSGDFACHWVPLAIE